MEEINLSGLREGRNEQPPQWDERGLCNVPRRTPVVLCEKMPEDIEGLVKELKSAVEEYERLVSETETNIEKAEEARYAAEKLRVKAEELRIAAEELRASAEEFRIGKEAERVEAERLRDQAESLRVEAERLRASAEQGRSTAYTEAEAARNGLYQTAEAARNGLYQEAETARGTAYTTAEGLRDGAFEAKEATRDAANEAALNCADELAALGPKIDQMTTWGSFTLSKSQISEQEVFVSNYLIRADNSLGKDISDVTKNQSIGTGVAVYKIQIIGNSKITYPVFKTSGGFGCLITNSNNIVIQQFANDTEQTGTLVTIDAAADAAYFYLSISSSLYALDYSFALDAGTLKQSIQKMALDLEDINNRLIIEKKFAFPNVDSFVNLNREVGTLCEKAVTSANGYGYFMIPCKEGDVFRITTTGNSIYARAYSVLDENDIVLQVASSTPLTDSIVYIPSGGKLIIFNSTTSGGNEEVVLVKWINKDVDEIDKRIADINSEIERVDSSINQPIILPFQAFGTVGSPISFGSNNAYVHAKVTSNVYVEASASATFSSFVQYVDANGVITRQAGLSASSFSGWIILADGETEAYISASTGRLSFYGSQYELRKDNFANIKNAAPSIFSAGSRDVVLGGIKFDIVDNNIPYQRGYLFHTWNNYNLYYGENFNNIRFVGVPDFDPRSKNLAVSPTDGRVIATTTNGRGSIFVYDGTTTTKLEFNSNVYKPMGWLYNSGVEFTKDGNNNEACLFAEYSSSPVNSRGVNGAVGTFQVWRGVYPYTAETDWSVVFTQLWIGEETATTETGITHFHQIRRDPWTGILYLTSGDASAESKWWYSEDHGETWTLLTSGGTSGYEDHICRIINFVFTKDYIYFATDHGTNHCLNRVSRDSTTGIIDVSSRVKIIDLAYGYATNSICYLESPRGLFFFDRIDIGYSSYYDKGLDVKFYSLDTETLVDVVHINFTSSSWGGHRGKCYSNYTNSKEPRPAMGFANDSKCIFDLVCPNPTDIGTIAYDVIGKVIRTIDR